MISRIPDELAIRIKTEQYIYNSYMIIKELVENAIDANSTSIEIILGNESITVSDNGIGISHADMVNVGEFAHTSKKLMALNIIDILGKDFFSLGFRGQALSAMSNTCEVSIKSCSDNSGIGYLKVLGSDELFKIPRPKGTTVVVSKLFRLCPVRKKINISTIKQQTIEITKYLNGIVHLFPVDINLIVRMKGMSKELFFRGNRTTLKEYCLQNNYNILFEHSSTYYTLFLIEKVSCNNNYVFINKRVVNSHILGFIRKCCFKFEKQAPSVIIDINDDADINLSADKSTVLLKNKQILENDIRNIIEVYYTTSTIKTYDEKNDKRVKYSQSDSRITEFLKSNKDDRMQIDDKQLKICVQNKLLSDITNKNKSNNALKGDTGSANNLRPIISSTDESIEEDKNAEIKLEENSIKKKISEKDFEMIFREYINIKPSEEKYVNEEFESKNYEEERSNYREIIEKKDFSRMDIIGQFNSGFIVCKLCKDNKEFLVAIDQHAADEIANYEKFRKEFIFQKQTLVRAQKIELTETQKLIANTHEETIIKNGFVIDEEYFLRQVPTYRGRCFDKSDFIELLMNIEKDPEDINTHICNKFKRIMAEKACRGSIMIGKTLTQKAMEALVSKLSLLDLPWKCPHGRPTFNILKIIK